MRSTLIGLLVFVFGPLLVCAQTGTEGSILGIVRDATDAVVPGVNVTITNLDTGLTKSAVTNGDGFFQVLALPRGFYSILASMATFKTWRLDRVELVAGEQKRVEPRLAPGDVKQEVTVQAGTALVQTERASVESSIEEKQIRDLPLNGRDPVQMVGLVPGMRYLGVTQGNVQGRQVQGLGQHTDATQFSIDGMDANDPSTETGMGFPNLDSVGEFRVQTSSYGAENGRQPLQVEMVTKSGTNSFHGTLWEFLRNDAFDARNAFTTSTPKRRRNQYGYTAGGPILKNRTFFFSSFEGLKIRSDTIYNSPTVDPAFLNGNFSSVKAITDPRTQKAFPGNQIPADRFDPAAKFFFPYILLPNAPVNLFQALAPNPEDGTNVMLRVDQIISSRQKLYVRWIRISDDQTNTGYEPQVLNITNLVQHNTGLNYDWTITPNILFTLSGGFLHSTFSGNSPQVGKENLTEQAGIQGFPNALRPGAIGLPTVALTTAYTGFGYPTQVPSSFKREVIDGRPSMHLILGKHTLVIGGEYLDHRTVTRHSSTNPRGSFTFNGQYTTEPFADYLLGLVQSASANVPLADFGVAHAPYSALYADDTWRVRPNLTLAAGLRWEYWWEKAFVRGAGTTFDTRIGKAVAGETSDGQVDLTAQPIAPFYAAATKDLWVPASQAGMPPGLFQASGYVSPRASIAWRPFGKDTFVVRAGYGLFVSSFNGNVTGSSIIGPPYWASQQVTFAKSSNQLWENAFPANPSNFVAPSVAAAVYNIKPMKINQFNVAVEKALPRLSAALTLSYVGSRSYDLTTFPHINTAPPGFYASQAALRAAMPYPPFGSINLYQAFGKDWYNSLEVKLDKRFSNGLAYRLSYAFARDISLVGSDITAQPTLYAPPNYDRGPSPLERRHILSATGIYELPFGRGKRLGSNIPKISDYILGGWQLSGIYSYQSGQPLTFTVPGATLGNGVNARPDIVGNPNLPNPSANLWFNPNAFANPPLYQFGNSGVGIMTGPSLADLDANLMKNFFVTEKTFLQFRWEVFNALNRVNLAPPVTTLNQKTTGQILMTNGDARQMQLALKFVF